MLIKFKIKFTIKYAGDKNNIAIKYFLYFRILFIIKKINSIANGTNSLISLYIINPNLGSSLAKNFNILIDRFRSFGNRLKKLVKILKNSFILFTASLKKSSTPVTIVVDTCPNLFDTVIATSLNLFTTEEATFLTLFIISSINVIFYYYIIIIKMAWTTEAPNLIYFSAPRGSGKSYLIVQMLLNKDLYLEKFEKIFIFSPSIYSPVNASIFQLLGIPKKQIFTEWDEEILEKIDKEKVKPAHIDEQWLVIVDDFISRREFRLSDTAINIMVNGRHKNLSLWITSQRNTLGNTTLRSNADQFITFALRSEQEMKSVYESNAIGGISKKQFYRMLYEATSEEYGFLNINYKDKEVYYSWRKVETPQPDYLNN